MPAPSIANWRRERTETRYMNTSVNQNSTSSWSSANMTPTDSVNYANPMDGKIKRNLKFLRFRLYNRS